jgi:hypothetical protein
MKYRGIVPAVFGDARNQRRKRAPGDSSRK